MEKQQALEVLQIVLNLAVNSGGVFKSTAEAYQAHVALQTVAGLLAEKPIVQEATKKK